MSEWEGPGQSDDWYTPAYIFDRLGCRFDMDVAAPRAGKGTFVPADRFLWQDSLAQPWKGFVWMNPPFGPRNAIAPWLEKFLEHGNGIALAPDRTSAPWFQHAARRAGGGLLFLSPKVKFVRPDGTVGKSPGSGTCLMGAGSRAYEILIRAADKLGLLTHPF